MSGIFLWPEERPGRIRLRVFANPRNSNFDNNGYAPGRDRTCGTRIRNPVLYPLSYGGMEQIFVDIRRAYVT